MSAVQAQCGHDTFWAEISPSDHFVQFYETDDVFLDTLEGFVRGGLEADEAAVIIATQPHLAALSRRLQDAGIDVDAAAVSRRYIALDAEESLAQFMLDGWPQDDRFFAFVRGVLDDVQPRGCKVRAFGEMVAILWGSGHFAATVRLEHLWQKLCVAQGLSLFCAYPKAGFTKDASVSIAEICAAHSQMVPS
jgi:MEDS: MEthanogen/methylotroph, DcmR Sensory domain